MRVPVLLSVDHALYLRDMLRYPFQCTNTIGHLIFATQTGDSGTCLLTVALDSSTQASTEAVHTCPLLFAPLGSDTPTSIRAGKLSLTLVNSTPALYVGGRVYVANISERLYLPGKPSLMTWVQWQDLVTWLTGNPRTKMMSAQDFVSPQKMVAFPVNSVDYEGFKFYEGPASVDGFSAHFTNQNTPQPHPMSTLVAYIPPGAATAQDWTVTVRATFETRWPLNTVQSRAQTPIPVAPSGTINSLRQEAEKVGSTVMSAIGGMRAVIGAVRDVRSVL